MELRLWLAFAITSLVIGLVPGPGVTSIVGYAMTSGRRTALASVGGMIIGSIIAMTISLTSVGTLLAGSATAFHVLKMLGAAYLVTLGILTLFGSRESGLLKGRRKPIGARAAFVGNVAVGALNPKTIMFFVAFAPQFINLHASYLPQAAILVATFGTIVACTDTFYALLASAAGGLFKYPYAARWFTRAGACVLIGAGVMAAVARRA